MPEALIVGEFGRHDPGGEAVLAASIAALPGWDLMAASADPSHTESVHLCKAVPDWKPGVVARAAAAADAVVVAGEPLLDPATTSVRNSPLRRTVLPAAGALGAGRPFAMLGVGAGGSGTRALRRLARRLARRADLIVLAEEAAAASLEGAGVRPPFRVGADPSWTLLDAGPETASRCEGVAVVIDRRVTDARTMEFLGAGLAALAQTKTPIALQPWGGASVVAREQTAARFLAKRLRGARVLDPPRDLAESRRTLGRHELVVTSGPHALAAAASAGVAAVAVSHDADVVSLARRLKQTFLHMPAGDDLSRVVLTALRGSPPPRAAVQERIAAAEEGFRLLRLLLSRGRSEEIEDITGLPLAPRQWADARPPRLFRRHTSP